MRKLFILIIICLAALGVNGQTDTSKLTPFEKYTLTDDFRQLQKRVRDEQIEDSVRHIPALLQYQKECAAREKQKADEQREMAKSIKDMNRKYGTAVTKKLLAGEVWLGMTDKMLLDAPGFGSAEQIRNTYTKDGTLTTWIYDDKEGSLVFKNHKLIAINE